MLFLILACTGTAPDSKTPQETADTADTAHDSGDTSCAPLAAIFFDLGETLVTAQEDGRFADIPQAIDLLDALDAMDMPMGLITNVPNRYDRDDLEALLVDPALLDRFAVVLLSSEATAPPKPDPAIYAEAVSLLEQPPAIERTAFLTEELEGIADADPPTQGAQAAGMIGVYLSDEGPSPLADHTVAPEDMAGIATADWVTCAEAR